MKNPLLCAEDIHRFREDGFVLIPNLLTAAEADLLKKVARLDRELEASRTARADGEGGSAFCPPWPKFGNEGAKAAENGAMLHLVAPVTGRPDVCRQMHMPAEEPDSALDRHMESAWIFRGFCPGRNSHDLRIRWLRAGHPND